MGGCTPSQIADAPEEPEDYILKVLDLIKAHPDWTNEQLLNNLKQAMVELF